MQKIKDYSFGLALAIIVALMSIYISSLVPNKIIGASVFALLIGMAMNPLIRGKEDEFMPGLNFVSKKILKFAIILMGASLSFTQVLEVGKYSLFVMMFTLVTAFGGGYLVGKLFKMDWKLSSLISAGTGICGGSAIAAISPTIEAKDSDVAYAISATFIFDVLMVILFPIMGRFFNMSDMGFGLWTGTAVNDTSSVVAAGYAFSDIAGNYAVIVKLTRTLSIVPIVLIFSYINAKIKSRKAVEKGVEKKKVNIKEIFPWFILMFLAVVALKSIGIITEGMGGLLSTISKFLMVVALASIGLKTNFKSVSKSGILPMVHGFIISLAVVVVSFLVQRMLGQI